MTKTDNEVWREILNNLREQRRHIRVLMRLSREQTHALAEADVERLAAITQQQAEHLDEIDAIENERRQLMRRIGEQLGLHTAPPTLTDCIRLAPENVARILQWLQQELLRDIQQVQALNSRNRMLVSYAAETVNTWLAVVVNAAANEISYHSPPVRQAVVVDTEV